ncbi:MAG: thiamine-phosphate kinase [Candidatus Thiodiazotropha sp.]
MSEPVALSEFDLIRRFFSHVTGAREDVLLGVGDDAALLAVPPGQALAVSVDTLVSGVHFLPSVAPAALGHKSLAVNLSDLAAMGAEPAWATLALTLPEADASWLQAFAEGFGALAVQYGVQLVGGDTTRGPLSVTVTVHGLVPAVSALRRSGARAGDRIYVTGCLGDAALYLDALKTGCAVPGIESLRDRLERPMPRVEAGLALRGLAGGAIDISDGLLADLGHILEASGVGARFDLDRIPLSAAATAWLAAGGDWATLVAGGDDYELCFTADPAKAPEIEAISRSLGLAMTPIGVIETAPGLRVTAPDGSLWQPARTGFDHFPPAGTPV